MSGYKSKIVQNKTKIGCDYHPKGTTRTYTDESIYPYGICPWLYYAVYPYMLGLFYGADFRYNKEGDAWVMCPAKDGCRTLVRKRLNTGIFDDQRIGSENTFVVYTEIVEVGSCPMEHAVGAKFIFPTCMKEHYVCPAAWFNAFPLMDTPRPNCLDLEEIRCPDWKSDVTLKIGKDKP